MENCKYRKLVKKFYVKLYIHQHKKNEESTQSSALTKVTAIRDATQSWHSLSSEDKSIFIELFKKRESNHKIKIANYLKKALPKQINELKQRHFKEILDEPYNETIENYTNLDIPGNIVPNESNNMIFSQSCSDIEQMDSVDVTTEITHVSHKPSQPKPPAALNAHQLFDLVNNSESEDYRPWNTLATTDRRRYQDALLRLKKEYLKKYELYLQNLTSAELHHHMIDILSTTLG